MANDDTIRGEPRYPVSLRVRVRLESWAEFEELCARDLSRGGMFLATTTPAPPGTQLRVELTAPDGRFVSVRAQVAHAVSPETAEAEGRRAGIGVRFLQMPERELASLEQLMIQAREVAAEGSTKLPATPADDESEEAIVDALRALLGELKEQTYFEVLGVPPDARHDDVWRGYLMQVQRWHPTRFQASSVAVRELAAEIFILVKHSFDALQDPMRREVFRQRVRARTKPPRNRSPSDSGAHVSDEDSTDLQFAKRLAREGRYAEARRVLTVALSHEPDDARLRELYNLMSARSALADGDPDGALLHFHEALRINPRNEEAVREIRKLMRLRRDARRRVLSRLFSGKKLD